MTPLSFLLCFSDTLQVVATVSAFQRCSQAGAASHMKLSRLHHVKCNHPVRGECFSSTLVTGAKVPLGLKSPLGCCVILCYITFCPDPHPWWSACEGTDCLSITGAGGSGLGCLAWLSSASSNEQTASVLHLSL